MIQLIERIAARQSYMLFALWLLLIVTYAPVINADYVLYDENIDILGNPLIKAPLTLGALKDIFTSFSANQFTPLSTMSFWLEYNFFGFNSSVSHLVNLLLHLAAASLVFLLLRSLTQRPLFSLVIASLWAVHPMQVETVAWALERRNLLYGLFYFASLHAYVNYQASGSRKDLAMATIFVALSGLAKALSFLLPVCWLMLDWLKRRKLSARLLVEKTGAFCVAAALFLVLLFAAGGEIANSEQAINNYQVASYGMSLYVAKTLLPMNLSAVCEINNATVGRLAAGPYYLLLLIVFAIYTGRKNRTVAFALLFYFLHILPLSGLIRVGYQFYAAWHFMYVPLLGVLIALVTTVDDWILRYEKGNLAMPAALVLILILAVISFNHSFLWQNSQTLFESCLKIEPQNRFARNQLALHFLIQDRFAEATPHYEEIIRLYPTFYGGYHGLGRINMALRQAAVAEEMFDKAVYYNVGRSDILNDRGYLRLFLKKFRGAEDDFSISLGYEDDVDVQYLRAESRRRQGDYTGAIDDMQLVIAAQSFNFSARASLFEIFVESGRYLAAIEPLLAIFREIGAHQHELSHYQALLFTPSVSQTLIRMLPFRNLFLYRLGWYPL
ncbi:MAG TPA: hypothetical protein PLM07_02450 [Candidatus Rifleibacterium sp.]|nr:hypothetical protein [Candidatus Rifleibacterium sp.]HPT44743.1 hypothetical protein [Candidatus Rifleibacterium sp.]